MKKLLPILAAVILMAEPCNAQEDTGLPKYLTPEEKAMLSEYNFPRNRGIETPPEFENLRNMAEWEEIQALTISWRSYRRILKEIARAAKAETKVIIFCDNAAAVESYLMSTQPAQQSWPAVPAFDNMENIDLVEAPTNSVWIRDYGANTVYGNRVDTLAFVDWIYNRPRPADDVIPTALGDHLGHNVYTTTAAPYDLVNTGGNFMSDGQGTGFASELILEENEPGNPYNVTAKTEEDIDEIKADFQGLSRFIKMTELPFDIISHIDMHMKLLDEETLLVGEYPPGVADGPQMNANIDYVVNNFLSYFGEEYKIIRVPMPDSPSGLWPDSSPTSGYYRTYTNGVFVNKTFIYPSYRQEYDTTAARIYSEALPGYTLVPIDCDNQPEVIIAAAGAIHCITHSVGVSDPLLIVHQKLQDTFDSENAYQVTAEIEHRTGIAQATLHYRISGETEFSAAAMSAAGETEWTALIPAQDPETVIEYYVAAEANSGKTQVRPIVAPEGTWSFKVLGDVTSVYDIESFELGPVYPNPARDIVSIPVIAEVPLTIDVFITDMTGRIVAPVFNGEVRGDRRLSANVAGLAAGVYHVVVTSAQGRTATPLMVIN
ncbi:MAG: agmatine deiminase family protein [Flavobacteriales bacterium]|nr:agmatine deiminase family protein [Flavobacteriales bacterium]